MGLVNSKVIDPNDVTSALPNYVNGAPEYEKMYIFAELIAKRRGRTTIVRENLVTSQQLEGLENDISINMMGFDQDSKEYTTRYSRNTSNSKSVFEGFGITKIDVKINASYVPQVTIDFVDVRGMAFANQGVDSPYSVLIDFPPPTFTLTLKGYYGRSLTYNLHLTKNSLSFDSSNGNYNITSEFIASTYAPLSDVPFKYIEMFPLIDRGTQPPPETTLNPDGTIDVSHIPDSISNDIKDVPKNTYELIKNIEKLYDSLKDLTENSDVSREYKETLETIDGANVFANKISNFNKYINIDIQNGATLAIINRDADTGSSSYFREIATLAEYNTVITIAQADGLKEDFSERLYLLVLRKTIKGDNTNVLVANTKKDKTTSASLQKLRKEYLDDGNRIDDTISKNDDSRDILPIKIKDVTYTPILISRVKLDETNDIVEYFGIDVTVLYQKLYKKWTERKLDSKDKRQEFIEEINTLAEAKLGLKPSIYNIFEIICNDVDLFFDKLRESTVKGESHHEEFKNQIITNTNFPDKKIGGYPRYVKRNQTGKSSRKARHIPDKKAFPNIRIFPEVALVDEFVDTFAKVKKFEEVSNLKTKKDVNNNSKWIPITPADSILYNTTDYDSPYLSLYFNSPQSAIIGVYERVLNRFYIGSEFTYGQNFFKNDDRATALVKYVAAAEANNIVASINQIALLNALKTAGDEYKTTNGVNGFYDLLSNRNVNGYSSFNSGGTRVASSPTLPLTNFDPIYRQRENSNFTGLKIIESRSTLADIEERTSDGEITSYKAKDAVDNFLDKIDTEFWEDMVGFFTGGNEDLSLINTFISENIPYFKDVALDDNFESDFILKDSFPDTWSLFLSSKNVVQYDTRFKEILKTSDYKNKTKLFIMSTNSTQTLGFMNNRFSNIKKVTNKFKFPAYVQTPIFVLIYMGGLVKYNRDSEFKNEVDNYFTDDIGRRYVSSDGIFAQEKIVSRGLEFISLEAPLVDNLSENDKDLLESYFDRKLNDTYYGQLEDYFIDMIEDYYTQTGDDVEDDRNDFYNDALKGRGDFNKEALSALLNDRQGMLNISELTFNLLNETNEFVPLTTLTGNTTILGETIPSVQMRNVVDTYFKEFFNVLSKNITLNLDKIQKAEIETQNLVSDDDIRTQTYYSFKSLADKWLPGNRNIKGFPFNTGKEGGNRLIDKFIFVDRGMNPIGNECIINIESLIDVSKNYDISVFNAMARLLSVNNFEFFPIANFMAFTDSEWENTFKIFETVNQDAPPAFVCMYLGGTSTTQSGDRNAFDNDGIVDLETDEDIDDIQKNIDLDESLPEVQNIKGRFGDNNPYGRISAFKVRYAEQNQSFFKNIQIDTREFPETNESLAILSKLAGDESPTSPVAKGQNLFSVYESRAYSANVDMLGNMMIQPTQYFQLENIPIFNGAYMVLEVNHNFTANHATTNFSGIKILKYPNPFITDVASSIALVGGTGNEFLGEEPVQTDAFGNNGQLSLNNIDPNVRTETNNSMYELKLK